MTSKAALVRTGIILGEILVLDFLLTFFEAYRAAQYETYQQLMREARGS